MINFARYVWVNKGREKYKKMTIPTSLGKCDFDPAKSNFIVNNQR